ncbi:GRAS transcription factor [Parasponia andersonii]|uniref:GRAS transcription factor n=1 Tax=Parasponia andersonii TaxID=3476 RepID=A0A2P5DQK0_PARAD|nr:GRAS transcription factor [Parasponia andersonii]
MDRNVPQETNLGFNTSLDQYPNSVNGMEASDASLDLSFDGVSPSDDGDFSDTVLKYINQMLMEEDMEAKPCMFHDPLALQAAEKSLYDVLCEKYPPSPNQHPLCIDPNVESPDDSFVASVSDSPGNVSSSSSSSTGASIQSFWTNVDPVDYKPSILQNPVPANFVFGSTSNSSLQSSSSFPFNFSTNGNDLMMGLSLSELQIPNMLSGNELMLQFNRGLEEGNKFLPKGNQLDIHLENNKLSLGANGKVSNGLVEVEKDEREHLPVGLIGRKNHDREETNLVDRRSNKQLAVYTEETEISELFDKVLLCGEGKEEPLICTADEANQNDEADKSTEHGGRFSGTSSGKTRAKLHDDNREVVDLRTLLISCAQAVSANDFSTANELLKQMRQHSSPFGDGSQRLAHYFANGLEARLAGTGSEIYAPLASKRTSAADMLKAYQAYISACPFKKIAIVFANRMILKAAEKATKLHIIDFGILYGFQWPAFIQCLSRRPGGPPKLRISGIELPQQGFRPAERVEETGHRLEKYCKRFGVPFEYNAVAQKWENIQIEDLKIDRNEVIAVNCLLRFKNLLDETVVVDSPRNAVLNLIRKIKPDIFVHATVNGSYNTPFFVTRFREALFNFASFFDVADATFTREDPMRLMFEKEFLGREVINVIACEGSERVERPETYKQWRVLSTRAGFRELPLDMELMKKLKTMVETGYHSDFVVDEDGNWMLQGWKGRVLYASSCWAPA